MACGRSPSTRGVCSRHLALLVFATLFLWLPGCTLPCAARVVRTYVLANATARGESVTVPEMQAACRSQTNGTIAIADSVEKDMEISSYIDAMRPGLENGMNMYLPLGGMMVSNRPDGKPPQSYQEARWCWAYEDGLCGPNNETLIGTHDGNKFITAEGRYSNWHAGNPLYGKGNYPYIGLGPSANGWYSFHLFKTATFACIVDVWIIDPTEAPTLEVTAPTTPPKKSLWWIALIVLAVLLVVVIIIVCVVCRCCCGAGAPVEEEYKSEDDDHMSVRDTRSNHTLVNRGDSMRSMGSRRGSAYSSSQCYSQDDMEVDKSYGDQCASQGRSGESYY